MKRFRFRGSFAPSLFIALGLPGTASPQDTAARTATIEERLAQIESRLGKLESRLEAALAPAGSPVVTPGPGAEFAERLDAVDQKLRIVQRLRELEQERALADARQASRLTAGREGFQLVSADGSYQLRFRGVMQFDARYFANNDAGFNTSTFVLRRVRPILEGTLGRYIDYRIMPDFGQGQTVLQDLFLDVKFKPGAKIRAGKFKIPFGLEQLQSESDILFVEKALPTLLVPNRDTGVQVSGDLWKGSLNYAVGVFNGAVDGGNLDIDDNNGKDFASRIFARPFRNGKSAFLQNIGIGVAATVGNRRGGLTSPGVASYRTSGMATFFRYRSDGTLTGTTLGRGTQYRVSPQTYYYAGPFGLMAEYVLSSQDVRLSSNAATLRNQSWQASASYVLTGENASYYGVVPRAAREAGSGGWGAWEIAGRFSQLNMDGASFPLFASPQASARRTREWAAGVNWYVNRNVKFVLNFDRAFFDGGAGTGNRPPENGILSRLQFVY